MWKRIAIDARAGLVYSLAVAALAGPTASVAGPGCMNNQRPMAGGLYPHSAMGPRAAYPQRVPYAFYAAPPPYAGMMPAPYNPSMPAQWNSPGRVDTPAAPAPVESVPAQSGPEAASSEPTPAGETVTVRIDGMRFEPASITVKPGTTVTWIQGSPMPHTITGNAEALRSNTLLSGQTYSHTFEAAGRYDYACDFHPSMKGSVIVEPAGRGT